MDNIPMKPTETKNLMLLTMVITLAFIAAVYAANPRGNGKQEHLERMSVGETAAPPLQPGTEVTQEITDEESDKVADIIEPVATVPPPATHATDKQTAHLEPSFSARSAAPPKIHESPSPIRGEAGISRSL